MGREPKRLLMALYLKENSKTVKQMAKEHLRKLTALEVILVNGLMI